MRTAISGAVRFSNCARSTSISSGDRSVLLPDVVAEPVCLRLHYDERVHIGLLLRSIRASRREGNLYVVPSLFRSFFNGRATAQNDQVSQRDLLSAGLRFIEVRLDHLQLLKDLCLAQPAG